MRNLMLIPAAMLVLALHASLSFAQETAPVQAESSPVPQVDILADEFDRGTPRRSLLGFLKAAQDRDFDTAAEYLDLRNLPSRMKIKDGPTLAHGISIVIQKELWIDLDEISDHPDGTDGDGLPSYRDKFAELDFEGDSLILLLQRVPRGDGEFVWKISNKTVAEIPDLYEEFGSGPVEEFLAENLPNISILNVELYKWVIVIGAALIAYPILLILLGFISGMIAKEASPNHDIVRRFFTRPFLWLLIIIILNRVTSSLGLGIEAQKLASAHTVDITIVTWVLLSATNLMSAILRNRMTRKGKEGAVVLLRPIGNAAKIVIVLFAILLWLNNLGFNITALVAGLGVGGIAIALALQKPLEDLFGAVSMYSQQPAKIGDFCKFGEIMGTIEEIGLRTTRIRTMANTVVSIPNAKIAGDILDNYSVRKRIWYHPKLMLRYDSKPKQLTQVLTATREMLEKHERVIDDPARVRLTGFGKEGFVLDVYAYISTSDYSEFLEIAEELNLGIINIVEKSGTQFAVPIHMVDER
jgi:MscS family membrane protein